MTAGAVPHAPRVRSSTPPAIRTIMRRLLPALLLAAALAVGACGSARPPEAGPPRTTVRVENRNFLDVRVYVTPPGGQRVRLGIVSGGASQVFEIPAYIVRSAPTLRFLADPIGSTQTAFSEEIAVIPGDEVSLIIPSR